MRHLPTLAIVVALTCGCAATPDHPRADDAVSFTLYAGPRNAGEVGTASRSEPWATARGSG